MFLLKQYTSEEIVATLKDMGPTKVPSIDGFLTLFFQKFWHIIGDDVSRYYLGVLNEGWDLTPMNRENIILLLKIPNLINMSNFQPISLCSIIYKIIVRMVVNRLRLVLDKCIDKAQSAFFLGRLITDNILVAYKVLHTMVS